MVNKILPPVRDTPASNLDHYRAGVPTTFTYLTLHPCHIIILWLKASTSSFIHSPLLSPSVRGALTFWSFWVLWLPAHGFTVFPHNPALLVHYFTSFLSPILCLLVHLLQLSCQCPTLNPASHLPSHSLSLHPTDGYYHNFTASHCSPAFRGDGCVFHPLSRSSLTLLEHHLSSH